VKHPFTVVAWLSIGWTAIACVAELDGAPSGELAPDDANPSAPPSSPETGAPETTRPPDAGPTDAAPSKALDVVCDTDPCYVAVSGNRSRHLCGLLRDGTVRCWGRDTMVPAGWAADGAAVPADGALGRGRTVSLAEGATPAPVLGLSNVTQLSVGPNLGTCARTSDGSVYCWGRNDFGQLGRPPTEAQFSTPRRVEGIPPVDEVQLGFQTGCAIGTSNRELYCWGRWTNGLGIDQAGMPTFAPQVVPTFRPPVKELAIGTWTDRDTIIALLDGGVLANIGEVLVGETSILAASLSSPVELAGVQHIGAFTYIGNDAVLRRWAPNSPNAADLAAAAGLKGPVFLPTMDPAVEAKVSAANVTDRSRDADALRLTDNQGGVLLSTGRLFRWGLNTAGTLGVHPDDLAGLRAPLEISQVKGEAVSFAIAVSSTCASLVSGKVKCWGSNGYGELGRGTIDLNPHPNAEEIR
jgi:alpha-tubulin suppressor-like RCC1 family protein